MKNLFKILIPIFAIGMFVIPSFAHATLSTNLISYWKLDESSGNASDATGNGYTLTNNGTVTYSGTSPLINNHAVFVGTSSQTLDKTNFSYGSMTNYSISLWFKYTSSSRMDIFDIYNSGYSTVIMITPNYISTGASAGKTSFNLYYSAANHFCDSSATGLNDGNWHHVVMTVSGSTQTIYTDGTLTGTNTGGGAMNFDDVEFGGNYLSSTDYYTGNLDEIGIWSRALTSSEVKQLYNSGTGCQYSFGSCPASTASSFNPMGWFRLFMSRI